MTSLHLGAAGLNGRCRDGREAAFGAGESEYRVDEALLLFAESDHLLTDRAVRLAGSDLHRRLELIVRSGSDSPSTTCSAVRDFGRDTLAWLTGPDLAWLPAALVEQGLVN
jgi:hypothetical protein